MQDQFFQDILRVCKALNDNQVEYLIIGGTVVAFHGYYRMSKFEDESISDKHDFDFWYNPNY